MTNSEIIMRTAIAKKVYTEEEAVKLIKTYGRLPLYTFQEWKKAGYSIKKGQPAKLSCIIWLPSTKAYAKKGRSNRRREGNRYYSLLPKVGLLLQP